MTFLTPPVRVGFWLVLSVLTVLPMAVEAQDQAHSLVRFFLDTESDTAFLRSHPELDVVYWKPRVHVDIVAHEKHLDLLRGSGARIEIVHPDLTAFYRSRIDPAKSDDFGAYHNWSEGVAFIDSLRLLYPQVISQKWSIGQGHEGRDLWCFRVSDNPDVDETEPEILFDGVHHAREPMSGEFCLLFAEYLAQSYGSDPEITWLLDNREVYFVPVVNPDGYDFTNWGEMWRKNRRDNPGSCEGVDINRNYPYEWGGSGSSTNPCDDDYRGPAAGSEPETQAMMALINSHQFVTHNSFHCYSNLTLYPWGYTTTDSPDEAAFVQMGDIMTRYNGYAPGQPGEVLWYSVSGGMIDWVYGAQTEHEKVYSFSNEIGGGGDGFWPAEERRLPLFQENVWPAVYLMRAAGPFVEARSLIVLGGDGNGRLDPGESADLSLTIENQGVAAGAQDVAVTLTCDDPYLQLLDAYRFVGTLAALQSTNFAGSPFGVTVAASCPNGRLARITASVEHASGTLEFSLPLLIGQPVAIFSDDFEGGTSDWTLTGGWDLTAASSHSPANSLTDSPGGDYPDESTTSATTSGAYFASSLSFWHRYLTESAYDYCHVQVSGDGGPWTTLATYDGFQSGWSEVVLPLNDTIGQAARIRFLLTSDTFVHEDGWYIDDVTLYGSGLDDQPPAAPEQIAPAPGATVGAQPTLAVENSVDPDGPGPVTYGFRVYDDPLLTNLVAAVDGLAEGVSQTEWTAPALATGTYWWRACAADPTQYGPLSEARTFQVDDLSGVGERTGALEVTMLGPVAGDRVRLQLQLPAAATVSLTVYDARGAALRRLDLGSLPAGIRIIEWDGRDHAGRPAASGVYFARLSVDQRQMTERFVLVR